MKIIKGLTACVTLFLLSTSMSKQCSAHPHVFVTVKNTIVVEKDQIIALEYLWTFDDDYASMALEDLDKNNDGHYDKVELQDLADTNLEGLKEFNYFTTTTLDQKKISFSKPKNYELEYSNKLLKLHFILPFAVPLTFPVKNLKISVEDPSNFIAFSFSKEDAFKFSKGAPQSCKVEPIHNAPNKEEVLLQQAFESQFNKSNDSAVDMSADGFIISCSK